MSENNNNGRKYTVDEILAEYIDKHSADEKVWAEAVEEILDTYDNDTAEEIEAADENAELDITEEEPSAEEINGILDAEEPAVIAISQWPEGAEEEAENAGDIEELEEELASPEDSAAEDAELVEQEEIFPDDETTVASEPMITAEEAEITEETASEETLDEEADDTDEADVREEPVEELEKDEQEQPVQEEITEDEEQHIQETAAEETEQTEQEEAADNSPSEEQSEPAVENEILTVEAETAEEEKKGGFWAGIFPNKNDSIGEIIRKIIFIVAVCVFVGAGVMLASTLLQSQKAQQDAEIIKEVVTTTAATTIDSDGNVITIAPTVEEIEEHNFDVMKYYKDINDDVKAYIELEGCDIYQPVVQGEDNEYYLTHTYYDGKNKAGSLFLDYRCRIEEDYTSPNLVVYGHNQEDGTMFGNLKDYKQNVEFYAANPTITFNTEYGVGTYLIYGYFVTHVLEKQDSRGEVFHYQDYIETMNDEYTYNWYINEVMKRTQIITPVEVEYGDSLLCLSTCSNEFSNSRFVVFARKLRDGESVEDYDFSEARINYNAKGLDWTAIMSGETTLETEGSEDAESETTVPEDAEATDPDGSETEETKKTKKKTSAETEEETSAENGETTKKTSKTKKSDNTTTVQTTVEGSETVLTDENGEAVTAPPADTKETTTETAGSDQ